MELIKTIYCDCGNYHKIYDYDIPGEFPCTCGKIIDPEIEEEYDTSLGFPRLIKETK